MNCYEIQHFIENHELPYKEMKIWVLNQNGHTDITFTDVTSLEQFVDTITLKSKEGIIMMEIKKIFAVIVSNSGQTSEEKDNCGYHT